MFGSYPDDLLPDDVLQAAIRHSVAGYPSEACGVIVRSLDGALRFRPMENVADRYHARDPVSFPRSSRDSYLFSPREQMEVWEASERGEAVVLAIVHSHCDCGSYFSAKDQDDALGGTKDTPLFPGVLYLVVSVRGAEAPPRVDDLRVFRWEGSGFREKILALPG